MHATDLVEIAGSFGVDDGFRQFPVESQTNPRERFGSVRFGSAENKGIKRHHEEKQESLPR